MDAIRDLFIGAVMNAAGGLFDTINEELLHTGDKVSQTPMEFSGGGPWSLVEGMAGTAGTTIQTIKPCYIFRIPTLKTQSEV